MICMDVDTALSEVPVNTVPLTDDTDFKTIEEAVAYNAAGLELIWHFTTTAGATTATVVTPTTAGTYDWAHQDGGMYTIEIPASGGASINNDTEGFGYFTGKATGVLPWRGPTICLRAAAINNALVDGSSDLQVDAVKVGGSSDAATGLSAAGIHYDTYDHFDTDQNVLSSAITTVNSQTEFVLTTGSTVDDAYNGLMVILNGSPAERWPARVVDYVGSTKTLTIDAAAYWTVDTNDSINIIAVPAQVTALPTATAGTTNGVFIAGTNAATTVTTSFTTTFTGNLTGSVGSVTGAVGSVTGAVGSVTGAVGSVTGNVGGNVTGSVGSVLGGINTSAGTITTLDGLDTAQDAQHSTTQTYLSTNLGLLGANATEAGGTGDQFTAIPWNASWDAEVQSEVNDGLVAFWTSPGTLVDLVWDELLSGHAVSGSTGEALSAAGTAGDPWTTSLPGSYTGTQAGKILADVLVDTGTTIPGTITTMQNDLDLLTGTDGATLATSQPNYAPATAAALTTAQNDLDIITGADGVNLLSATQASIDAIEVDTSTTLPATLTTIEGKVDTVDAVADAILVDTAEIGAAGAGLTEAGGTGDQLTALATQVSVDDLPTNAELATAIITGLTTALTEGYRSTGSTGSVRDMLYEMLAHLGEFAISGTTKTTKKLDGSTTAKVYTLDDDTAPTSITETT